MSRSVTFNGITQFRPGGLTKVDANALAQIGLSPNGIIGLIGEAEGGAPNVVTQIDDPALAVSAFKSGPLADAIRVAFDPSSDPRVPAGAFRVLAVKTNQGTQSTLPLRAIIPPVAGGVPFDTVSAPLSATVITLTTGGLTVDAHIGNTLRIGTEERTITDNDASTVTVSPGFSTAPLAGTPVFFLSPALGYTSKDYGSHTNRIKQELESGGSQGAAWTTALDSSYQSSEDLGGKSFLDVEYIGQSVQVVVDSGTTDGAGDTNTIVDSLKAWGTNALQYFYVYVSGGALTQPNLRKIASNDGTSIDAVIPFANATTPTAPGSGATYAVRRGAVQTGTLASATASTVTLEATLNLGANDLAGLVLAITGGTGAGQRRVIASHTAGVSSVLTLVQPFTTTPDGTSTYAIRYVTKATATITGSAGKSTSLSTSVAVNGGVAAGDLSITFTNGMTLQDLVNLINANADYMAYVPNGINMLALVNDFDFDNGSYQVEIRTDRSQNTTAPFPLFVYSPTTGTGDSVTTASGVVTLVDAAATFTSDLVGQMLQFSGGTNAGNRGFFRVEGVLNGTTLFYYNPNAVTETSSFTYSISAPIARKWNNHFQKNLQLVINDINEKNTFSTVARSAGTSLGAGAGMPEFTGSGLGSKAIVGDYYKYMSGAIRGTSTNTNWQNAFDTLLRVRAVSVVPLISEDLAAQGYGSTATFASVAAQLAQHVSLARGVEKTERGGYIGMKGTKAQYIAQLNSLNDMDVSVTNQYLTVLNASGNLVQLDPWASAVAAAGMRAGMPEVGEPLTHKYLKTTTLYQDPSWDPASRTDANLLIQNGALFAEYIAGKGIRWVRDLTSYIQDDNLAYAEGSVRDVVRYTAYGLRTLLEDRFTGVKASPANATSIKEAAANYLELLRGQNIIVDSTDSTGKLVHAFHNLRVTISGDIARIRVEIFPAVGINFQLTEIFLQLPTQAA